MDRKTKLLYNTGTSVLYEAVAVICGLILPRMYLSTFGSEVNGLVNSIGQFLSIFTFSELGVNAVTHAALYKPLADGDMTLVSKIYVSARKFYKLVANLSLLYVIILMVIYPLGVREAFSYPYTAILIAAIAITSFSQYYFGKVNRLLLEADQRSYIPHILSIVSIIISTVSCIILMKAGASIQIVKLASSCAFLIRPVGAFFYVKKRYPIQRDIVLAKGEQPIPQKWNGVAQSVSASILSNTDVVVLTLFSTLHNVSIYSVYFMVVSGIRQIIMALTNGFKSMLGNLLATGETALLQKTFGQFEWFMHTLVTLLYTITGILIVPFVMVYTHNITDANYIRPVFAVLITIAIASHCIRLPYNTMVLAAGHFKQTQVSCIIEVAINIVISVVLVLKFELIGVAIGTVAAMFYRTIYLMWYLSKNIVYLKISSFIKRLAVDALCIALMIPATSWISLGGINYFSWAVMAVKVGVICAAISLAVNMIFYRGTMKGVITQMFTRPAKRHK